MKPAEDIRVWRKSLKAAMRGVDVGRRSTHRAFITGPRRGSTWTRRHPGRFGYYLEFAGKRRVAPLLHADEAEETR